MMTPYTGPLAPEEVAELLYDMTPVIRSVASPHADALAAAITAVSWFPLAMAPRDGTKVILAVAPALAFDLPGFICIGRWVEPDAAVLGQMGRKRRARYEAAGGWWTAGKAGRPFDRPVLAWKPQPSFDFEAAGYVPDTIETVGGARG